MAFLSFQFAWLAENYDAIRSYFGDSSFGGHVSAMLGGFAADANFPSDIGELEAFLDAHGEDLVNILRIINDLFSHNILIFLQGDSLADLQISLDSARRNAEWVEANFVDVLAWLEERKGLTIDDGDDGEEEEDALELPLSVDRPERAVVGEEASFSCVLGGEGVIVDEACTWENPDGDVLVQEFL